VEAGAGRAAVASRWVHDSRSLDSRIEAGLWRLEHGGGIVRRGAGFVAGRSEVDEGDKGDGSGCER
jgi:hypothetical protein